MAAEAPFNHTAYYASPVGMLRVSSTDTVIRELHFLDQPVVADQQSPAIPVLQQCIDQLIEYFAGQRRVFTIPVHQVGTAFQQRVWNELLSIPFGKTISYMDMAKRLGDPKVIRAAAAANGKNNIAIIVPCHRVIGANRELVGYAGGLWRKKWLLQMEAKQFYGIQTLF